ncbi:hypothetical protein M899_0083 [Bacteriovorax sp. BSW11_IV]|uniref:ribonuclease J n=1 Tax=Bacteriovorax sp. BSW11_IV TaxID=1353529 RepID=UPI00038A1142|nr:ribonuclease J [Bacteriovorax sp. BSW11_IV]EQC42929.1 hypothetical protein M899_0083 [Bacteriovorax sp. BSW11_IV]
MSKKITLTPIGGVGQIGSNSTLIKYKNEVILIDCGILFPYEDFFDINYLIPDLSKVEETPNKLIITHGHEDHIGAIVHFILQYPEVEVHAPLFAKKLIERKLGHKKMSKKIHLYNRDGYIECDGLNVLPIQVNHSIPDTYGMLLNIDETSIFFVSDFKIDQKAKFEPNFDFEKLKKNSEGKFKILLADSTNIKSKNLHTPSEEDIFPELEEIIKNANGRIFITSFASNVFRIRNFILLAEKYGKRLVPHGRSMINYIATATECEHIHETKVLRELDQIDPNDPKLIVLLSGCQGDFKGAFRRVAKGEDSNFKVKETDTFVISSKAIPGSEKKISLLINSLYELGAKVINNDEAHIHVSGHPGKEDLRILYDQFSPDVAIPIHGETEFLYQHAKWIDDNYPKTTSHVIKNFDSVQIEGTKVTLVPTDSSPEPILIHGQDLPIEKSAISERRKMACNGVIFISINKESLSKRKISIECNFMGLPLLCLDHKEVLLDYLHNFLATRKVKLLEQTSEDLRVETRRFMNNILGYKPITIVQFV